MRTISIPIIVLLSLILILSCGTEKKSQDDPQTIENRAERQANENERRIPVEAIVLKPVSLEQTLTLTGVLRPLHTVDIMAEVSGKVTRINKEMGDRVTTRDTLAYIDDKIPYNNYRQARARLLSAENDLKIARLNLESDKELHKNGDISDIAYQNSILAVKNAEAGYLSALANLSVMEKQYKDTRIVSPVSGFVAKRFIDLGTMVTPNMLLYTVVDLTYLKLDIGIPQDMINLVRAGSPCTVTISALDNTSFPGTIRYISPQAEAQSGAFPAEVEIKNTKDYKIRGGMTAKVTITLKDHRNRIAVPDYAVISKNGDRAVYKIRNHRAYLTPVSASSSFGSQIIIDKGLADGDTIVVVGMKNLGIDSPVWIERIAEQKTAGTK